MFLYTLKCFFSMAFCRFDCGQWVRSQVLIQTNNKQLWFLSTCLMLWAATLGCVKKPPLKLRLSAIEIVLIISNLLLDHIISDIFMHFLSFQNLYSSFSGNIFRFWLSVKKRNTNMHFCYWMQTLTCLKQFSQYHLNLTHWGRVTYICVSDLTNIGSDNGLSPALRQAIIWTNAGILLIEPLGTNFS